ncbi:MULTISPECIES: hypothetical protein [Desulfosediminicola]|uniref:hypothetical protein n=1 Tax=Desulfosediminicola TaxID=2886823 RepID=UPI0010AD5BDC|nr:hypothetical protein [Desulfosediminicola ganghwensis]
MKNSHTTSAARSSAVLSRREGEKKEWKRPELTRLNLRETMSGNYDSPSEGMDRNKDGKIPNGLAS